MLHGDELVALLAGLHKGHVQADFQFLGNHGLSFALLKKRIWGEWLAFIQPVR
jgi:hypothetical protein